MRNLLITLIVFALTFWMLTLFYTPPTQAAVLCRNGLVAIPFSSMLKILKRQFNEVPTHLGTSGSGTMVQFSNKEKGTMSLVYVNKQGLTCMIGSAEDWEYNSRPNLSGTES